MIKLPKLPLIEKSSKRMLELLQKYQQQGDQELWWQLDPETGLQFGGQEDSVAMSRDIRFLWLAAYADFFQRKSFAPFALFQLGAREVESYLRDANHLPAFVLEDAHEQFHLQFQESLAYHLTQAVLLMVKTSQAQQSTFPDDYVSQAAWLKRSFSTPLVHYFAGTLSLEWVYYGMRESDWVMVWSFGWRGPSELWTHSTKQAFEKGFLQAGSDFSHEHLSSTPLKWVAELDQLP